MRPKQNFGILLAAYGQKYIEESKVLVQSIRKIMPTVGVSLITDNNTVVPDAFYDTVTRVDLNALLKEKTDSEISNILADAVDHAPKMQGFLFKVKALSLSPYDRTLFLDSDTIIGHPINDVFHLLNKYDVLVGYAPTKIPSSIGCKPVNELKKDIAVPRINTGVVGYSRSAVEKGFLAEWEDRLLSGIQRELHLVWKNYSDQSEFRGLLWNSSVNALILPVEYHLRMSNSTGLEGPVRILHGRPAGGRENMIRFLNATHEKRIWISPSGILRASDGFSKMHPYSY